MLELALVMSVCHAIGQEERGSFSTWLFLEPRLLKVLASMALSFTASSMIGLKDPNPVRASTVVVHGIEYALGKDFCPAGPSTEESEKIASILKHETLTEDRLNARAKASERGLHFGDSEELRTTMHKIVASEDPQSATHALSGYMKPTYGFDIVLRDKSPSLSTAGGLASYRADLENLLTTAGTVPIELLKATNVSRLVIKHISAKDSTGLSQAGGLFNPNEQLGKPMVVELDTKNLSPEVVIHELLGHGIQNKVCRDFRLRDPALTNLNPSWFKYIGSGHKDSPYDETVNVSGYGKINPDEDQATIITDYLINPDTKTDEVQTPVGKKLIVLLDRFENIAPGSVDYLNSIRPILSNAIPA